MNEIKYTLEEIRDIPIFFIVGKGRSGTTLLSTILDSHPNVASATESRFLLIVWQRYKSLKAWKPEMAEEFYETVLEDYRVKYLWDFKKEFISVLKSLPKETTVQDLIKLVYIYRQSPFPKEKIQFIVDKNPRYTLFIGKLGAIFKEGNFIRVMRDPRDNITSHVKFTKKKVGYLSKKWLEYNKLFDAYQAKNQNRYLTLRFEDLVLDKESFFEQFEAYTGISGLSELEDMRLNYKGQFEAKLSEELKVQHQATVKPLDPKKIGHFKQKLDDIQIKTIESVCFPYAESYHYQLSDKKRMVTLKEAMAYELSFSFHKYGNLFLYNLPYVFIVWMRAFLIRNVFQNKRKKLQNVKVESK